ncbi:aminoglycoside adenylyltransferase domain-containing protein [Paenibacillus sp. J2TS4]|uniref:aminoglycoside adenylyltransferase domain-containing protein n=1 Tax=Paenibacillus sp. J2TS4 TaxID=2807194 RepID=UPI001B190902|nr:aminoglycoside adenylyltransferase domain-containing protein [Paenibacillus sp. J2TS4]GIP36167.1 hypothetical protein J2TS4_53770 [Paenibacillus sp. J2TS4]
MKWNAYWGKQAASVLKHYPGEDERTVEYTVLSLAKIVYGMDCLHMATRAAAGQYALSVLPPRWHKLIREALRINRIRSSTSYYESEQARTEEMRQFIRYVIDYCEIKRIEEEQPSVTELADGT